MRVGYIFSMTMSPCGAATVRVPSKNSGPHPLGRGRKASSSRAEAGRLASESTRPVAAPHEKIRAMVGALPHHRRSLCGDPVRSERFAWRPSPERRRHEHTDPNTTPQETDIVEGGTQRREVDIDRFTG
jgi:hypothetical protein